MLARIVEEDLWASYWVSNEYLKDQGVAFFFGLLVTLFKHFTPLADHPSLISIAASSERIDQWPALVQGCKNEEEAVHVIDLLQSMILDLAERPSVRQVTETHRWPGPDNFCGVTVSLHNTLLNHDS